MSTNITIQTGVPAQVQQSSSAETEVTVVGELAYSIGVSVDPPPSRRTPDAEALAAYLASRFSGLQGSDVRIRIAVGPIPPAVEPNDMPEDHSAERPQSTADSAPSAEHDEWAQALDRKVRQRAAEALQALEPFERHVFDYSDQPQVVTYGTELLDAPECEEYLSSVLSDTAHDVDWGLMIDDWSAAFARDALAKLAGSESVEMAKSRIVADDPETAGLWFADALRDERAARPKTLPSNLSFDEWVQQEQLEAQLDIFDSVYWAIVGWIEEQEEEEGESSE